MFDKSLLNCTPCAPSCLRSLPIIDTRLTHCVSARLRVLPIVIACLTHLGTLLAINMRLHAFTLKHFSSQFFTRLTLHGMTNQYLSRETDIKYLQFSSYTLFYKQHYFSIFQLSLSVAELFYELSFKCYLDVA